MSLAEDAATLNARRVYTDLIRQALPESSRPLSREEARSFRESPFILELGSGESDIYGIAQRVPTPSENAPRVNAWNPEVWTLKHQASLQGLNEAFAGDRSRSTAQIENPFIRRRGPSRYDSGDALPIEAQPELTFLQKLARGLRQ